MSKEIKNLYIISVLSIKEKCDEDYEKDAKIKSIIHGREITKEHMKTKFKFSEADSFKMCIDEVSYFDNLEGANEFLEENRCDVYEYCYDYGVIIEVPLNCAYPSTYVSNMYLYKYDIQKKGYKKITKENLSEKMYKAICATFNYNEELAKQYRKE